MKKEKGAITLYVSVACLFILIIGVVAYVGVSNKQASQIAALGKIESEYNNSGVTAEDLYQNYDGGDIVPIYTPEQFALVGSGEQVYVEQTGKFYTFSVDKTYMFYGVQEDLELLLGQLKEEIKSEVKVEIGTGGGAELGTVKVGVLTLTKNTNQLANSVTITATANSEKGIITFVTPDKVEKLYESGTTEIEETYEITSNGTHTFKVVEADGTISDAQIVITNVIGTNIGMQLSTNNWTNQDVIVTVTWPDGSESGIKEIKVDDGSWTRYTGLTTDITCAQNCTVYARVTNGTDDMKTSEVAVSNIDKNPVIITQIATEIECGDMTTIFEIESNGNSPYIIEYNWIESELEKIPIDDMSILPVGTHTVECKVWKQSGTRASKTVTITVNRLSGTLATNTTIKPSEESNVQIVIPAGFAPAILEGSDSTTSLPGQSGKVKGIMPSDQWNSITVDQINKGIVVVHQKLTYDGGKATGTVPDYDEYVWVPIPESSNFATTSFCGETLGSSHYWDDTSTAEYINMVASVNANKGFYISRYEASYEYGVDYSESRYNYSDQIVISARSRRNVSARKGFYGEVEKYSNDVKIANAHLIYGIEWDSIMNWLVNSKATIGSEIVGTNKEITLSDITSDSRSWGNYMDSTGDAATGAGSETTTGYSEYWKANNIYDLSGNRYEWTQEKFSSTNKRVIRGGNCFYEGEQKPAGYRSYESLSYSYGFRFSFYL